MYRVWKPKFEMEQLKRRKTEMLRQPSNGLLGSSFNWSDIQKTIDLKYNGDIKFGNYKKIEAIAVGVGLQSLLGILHGDWMISSNSSINIPEKIILKIASPLAMISALNEQSANVPAEVAAELVENFVNFLPPCHNSEVYFYEQVEKMGIKIEKIPSYYFGEMIEKLADGEFSKGCVGIELIENVQTMSPAQNFNDSQIKQVLRVLAQIETSFLQIPEDSQNMAPHNGLEGLYSNFQDPLLQLNNTIMSQIPHPALASLTANFAQLLPQIITSKEIDKLSGKLGMKKVIVHGDLWSANLLWNGEKLEKIVDFQMIHFGLAATDLTRFFNTCLEPKVRKEKWQEYLKFFYNCLTEYTSNLPYTYEQLEKTYRLVYPRTSAYLLPALLTIVEKVNKMEGCEIKMNCFSTIISKIIGIYEDIIEYHNSSRSIE